MVTVFTIASLIVKGKGKKLKGHLTLPTRHSTCTVGVNALNRTVTEL